MFFFSFVAICNGQEDKISQFQHDSVKFLDDLEVYLNSGLADKSSVKEFLKEFTPTWKSPAYNTYYKRATYRIADEMLAKKNQDYRRKNLISGIAVLKSK